MADTDHDKNSQIVDPESQTSQPSDPTSSIPEFDSPIDDEPESRAVEWFRMELGLRLELEIISSRGSTWRTASVVEKSSVGAKIVPGTITLEGS